MQDALDHSNMRSAPGPDGVTHAELRNLPTEYKLKILKWINEVWKTGRLPGNWEMSLVLPIPKPGKPPTTMRNLRPISLTSNICKLMERMALARIQWHLDKEDRQHHCQTGFRSGLSTQDNFLMLHHDVLADASSIQPKTVVAVDVQKAFDSVPHSSVIESAKLMGIQDRALNLIRNFLKDRRFQVKIGSSVGPETINHAGVPQGAVLSANLFNMVMAHLSPRLTSIPNLRFAIYADCITLWSTTGSVGKQEHTLQCGLNAVQSFLEDVGMTASPEKTEYVVVLSGPQHLADEMRGLYNLTLNNTTIRRERTVRILGLFIDEVGRAGTWLSRVKKEGTQIIHFMRRVTNRKGGTGEKETRQLAQALFSTKVLYGYNYYYLTQRQRDIVENLNKEAIRLITGLPKHTWLPDLYAHGNLNKLEDVAEQLMSAQLTRLLGTKAGQAILQEIGRLPSSALKPPPLPPPPWERHVTSTADAPLPRRMDADHPERRAYHARVHERHVAALDPRQLVVYYTDAASGLVSTQGASPTSAAWVNITHPDVWSQRLPTGVGIKGAELEAIVQAAQHAELNHSETSTTNITIYTDPQVAYSEFRHASKSTSDRVHKNLRHRVPPAYQPPHSTPCRLALSRPSAPIVPTIYSGPHFDSSQPDDSQPDLTERAALAKLERKKILRNLRTAASLFNRHNRMIPPMPAGVSRKAQTLVRRTATNTLMLPALRHRIFKDDPQQGYCTACNTFATTQHVIWECPEHAAARFEALADIPLADQPNTFEDWVITQDKPPPTVRLLWNQLCSFFYADGGPAGLLPRWPSVSATSLQ
ncbi:hypothetical protein HPB47_012454 [Ixodes persulcatus]|uniref:Uncharacterized protein n=1 Tax=Ixodes persulcatus TaxID=34615 RepID=A0AC60NTK5_IXOPE|nr:hypothetical protein HPB47_012454 [Ixodes persulcatus]